MSLQELLNNYATRLRESTIGPGQPEAQISQPVASLIEEFSQELMGTSATIHREVPLDDGSVRPDFGVRVKQLITGHVELKAPGTSLDPDTYGKSTHNGMQWQRLKNIPNLLHTNGTEWRLWRYGEMATEYPARFHTSDIKTHRGAADFSPNFEGMLRSFLTWEPAPIFTAKRLVATIAPLASLLREDVVTALKIERSRQKRSSQDTLSPFLGLKEDWQAMLYPHSKDEEFADGFAQTVVFSLVIALSEGQGLEGKNIAEVARELQGKHTLLGRSLDLLTEHIQNSTTAATIETITRALSATQWQRITQGRADIYLHLYEHFLTLYDSKRRESTGSYYTPVEIVDGMVSLTDQALRTYLNRTNGFSDESVSVIDPAMGTGTYPLSVLRSVARENEKYGAGAVADAVSNMAERLYGIELQSGPFSVAELRVSQAVVEHGGTLPDHGLNLFVADTLEDPAATDAKKLSYTLQLLAEQRHKANEIKLNADIQVCIGNPPYDDKAKGKGGWVESGNGLKDSHALADDFRQPGNGRNEYVLKNLYVYFWRWAMWKVFESTPNSTSGITCFITATGYLAGPGFAGMREYIRRNTSRGWIINVTPEGKQPPAKNAVFNIETPVAIALFLRDDTNNTEHPSDVRYIDICGTRQEKFNALASLTLNDPRFESVDTDWDAKFTPGPSEVWRSLPTISELFVWASPGIKPNKKWVYSPSPSTLEDRWSHAVLESDKEEKRRLFRETDSTKINRPATPLPGEDTEKDTHVPFDSLDWPADKPAVVPVGFRAFDRQYLIADSRLLHRPVPELWNARAVGSSQLFVIEQHAHFPGKGPGLMFSELIPDMHHFNNRGGRAFPLYHPNGEENLAGGLCDALALRADEWLAYVAGILGFSGYVDKFEEDVRRGGVRVPITQDSALRNSAIAIGNAVLWLHTHGHHGSAPDGIQSVLDATANVPLPSYEVTVKKTPMPDSISYDATSRILTLGSGEWRNVKPDVWDYTVGGKNVIHSWFGYRKRIPAGLRNSPLDSIVPSEWPTEWSKEFHELLATLTWLVHLEPRQAVLLETIMGSPLISRDDLQRSGVVFPTRGDRKPRSV